jgi:hypothetical protein
MRFRHEMRYDAPADRVYAMVTDEEFRERVCVAVRSVRHSVGVAHNGSDASVGATVTVRQAHRVVNAPGFARRLVGDTLEIVQVETWADAGGGRLEVTTPGRPGHLRGTVTLSAVGAQTLQTVAGDLHVPVPLVGTRLEEIVAGLLGKAMDVEQRVGREWLADPANHP